ncbi:S9 family peptidase [Pseudonocardia sp. KRD291]|uniref:alpha/beta hydrolase family protein n=1 Tax=Pseudonocardia sp. KRD291 TaxID=2792007 RepID=UPI001C49FC75|nr:alpha/beta fold hydrolase [Pseudonocardia sp. KRD291]MBW0103951.1 prolyl oligopeptidase family serine peptidase [Pseudonocardia sp. KRD291]
MSRRRLGASLLSLGALAAAPVLASCGASEPAGRGPGASATPAPTPAPQRRAYGSDPSQFGEFTEPAGSGAARGIVVIVHGGFWRSGYDLSLGRPLAADLSRAGWATWNIEYRRVGGGGGWTSTFDDAALALDHLATVGSTRLDLGRVYTLGHSAGGHLAAWLAGRPGLPPGSPGGAPRIRVAGVVAQAGVLDLVDGADLGAGAVVDLMGGGPADVPERYTIGSPAERTPLGVPSVCVHGTADANVPIVQSERFVQRAVAAGDRAELVRVEGADHFDLIDVASPAWKACTAGLDRVSAG